MWQSHLIMILANVDWFSKFFHQLIREKILYMYVLQRFPPHLQYVATLPCEIRKSKNFTLNVTVNVLLKFTARSYVTEPATEILIILEYVYNTWSEPATEILHYWLYSSMCTTHEVQRIERMKTVRKQSWWKNNLMQQRSTVSVSSLETVWTLDLTFNSS